MVQKTNHTQEQWTVIMGLSPVGSLDRNPGNTLDSMRAFSQKASGQVKTSSRQFRFAKSKLSKPFAALTQVASGRVNQLNTTYKQLNQPKQTGGV